MRSLRGWPLLSGGRGGAALDVAAASFLATAVGDLLLTERLELIELNPVVVATDGAVAVDALVTTNAATNQGRCLAPTQNL